MKIIGLQIDIVPDEKNDPGKSSKSIMMDEGIWRLPELYPREIRFVAELERMIQEYNRGNK